MIYLQLLITAFIVFILLKLFWQKQTNKISFLNFFFWLFLWLIVLIVFWLPNTTSYLASFLGIGRGADLVLYISIVVIFYLLFKIFARLNKIEIAITNVIREDAIKNVKEQ